MVYLQPIRLVQGKCAHIYTCTQTFNCVSIKYISCGIAMRERNRRDITDGICWYCPGCKTTKSIRDGSFFAKSRLPLQKWMIVMYWWARQYSVSDCKDEAEIDKRNAIDMYQWLREVCSTRLLQDPPIVLGGQGAVLQIDESLFRHKPKVTACTSARYSVAYILSTQNHRGRATTQEVWVFGIVSSASSWVHGSGA